MPDASLAGHKATHGVRYVSLWTMTQPTARLLLFKIVEAGNLCLTHLLHQLAEFYPNLAPPLYASNIVSIMGIAGMESRANFYMSAASVRVHTLGPNAKEMPAR